MSSPNATSVITILAFSLLLQGCFLTSKVTDLAVKTDSTESPIGDPAFSNNPTSLYISGVTYQSLQLTWTAPAKSFDSYKLAYLQSSTAPTDCAIGTTLSLASNLTNYAVMGLLADTTYSFRLCSVKNGTVTTISEGSFVTGKTLIAPPNNPISFSGVASSISQINLTWASGGGTTVDYRISYQTGATAPTTCDAGTMISESLISGTGYSVTGLTANTQYSFRLCAINGNLTPDVSSGVTTTVTTLQTPPPNPSGLTATPNSDTQITLSWTSGGGSTSGFIIAYQAGANNPADCTIGTVIPASSIIGTSHAITGLTASTAYRFRVCAINSSNSVSSGITVAGTTLATPQAPPPNPTGLTSGSVSDSSVNLSWTSGGGTTADYRISYQTGATAPATCAAGTTISESLIAGTTHSVTGLSSNTQYSFRLCAINGNATPDVSSGITYSVTTAYAAPPNVTGLTATPTSDTQINLSWTSGGGSTSGYRIAYVSGVSAPANCATGTQVGEGSITGTSHTISSLTAATQYSFRVCAINANGTPDVSSGMTATATTLQAAPPNPTGLTATPGGIDSEVTLSWISGGGSTVDYRISYQSGGAAPATCAAGTTISESAISGTSHTVTGLTGGTLYSFRVCAINGNAVPYVSTGITVFTVTKKLATALRTIFTSEAPNKSLNYSIISKNVINNQVIIKDTSDVYKILNVVTGVQSTLSLPGISGTILSFVDITDYSYSTNNYRMIAASNGTNGYILSYNIDTDTYTNLLESDSSYGLYFNDIDYAIFDNYFYVMAYDSTSIRSVLYRTNGASGGTNQVLTTAGAINLLESAGSYLYVSHDPNNTDAKELYRISSGATSSLTLVKDICPGNMSCHGLVSHDFIERRSRGVLGTNFYFVGTDGTTTRLYKTDGTSGGTVALTTLTSEMLRSHYVTLGSVLLFDKDGETWKTDGTVGGTTALTTAIPFMQSGFTYSGNYYWVAESAASNFELWKTDGTPGGTALVDTLEGLYTFGDNRIEGLYLSEENPHFPYVILGTDLIYPARKAQGVELYKVSLTGGGAPVLVKDITPGSGDGVVTAIEDQYPANLFKISPTHFLFSGNLNGEAELWISDGTSAGTILLKDINTHVPGSSIPTGYMAGGAGVIFYAISATHGRELWTSDGTAVGTVEVFDSVTTPIDLESFGIVPVYGSSNWTTTTRNYAPFSNNKLMSIYFDPFRGSELFQLDIVNDTFDLFSELVPGYIGTRSSGANQHSFFANTFFFPVSIGHSTYVHSTDGTLAGTVDALGGLNDMFFNIVFPRAQISTSKVIIPPSDVFDANLEFIVFDTTTRTPSNVSSVCGGTCGRMTNGAVVSITPDIVAYADPNGDIWKTDGTAGGTAMLNIDLTDIDLNSGTAFDSSKYLFFAGKAGVGYGLWATNGTQIGTELVLNLNPSYTVGDVGRYAGSKVWNVNNVFYAVALDSGVKSELYTTGGTGATTSLVKTFNATTQSIFYLVGAEQADTAKIFVLTGDYQNGISNDVFFLNPSDGTLTSIASNTTANFMFTLSPIQYDNVILFQLQNDTDGTFESVKNINVTTNAISTVLTTTAPVSRMCNKGGRLYFTHSDATYGTELWYSNGLASGTQIWQDANPGVSSSEFGSPIEINNKCYLWGRTNSTANSKIFILDF